MRLDLLTAANLTLLNTSSPQVPAGATFRPAEAFGMSCQFYQPPLLNYINASLNEYVIGVSGHLFRKSRACHQCVLVNGELAIIGDYCPKCTPYQLDLNPFLSRRLNKNGTRARNYAYGELAIKKVDCAYGAAVKEKIFFDKGSTRGVLYMIPLYLKKPLKLLVISDGIEARHDLYGRWVSIHRERLNCGAQYSAKGCYDAGDCFEYDFNCTSILADRR